MGSFVVFDEVNIRYTEMLREAEQDRLARQVRARKPKAQKRVLRNLGDALISLGQSLRTLALSL
jgi:hypothetical protein